MTTTSRRSRARLRSGATSLLAAATVLAVATSAAAATWTDETTLSSGLQPAQPAVESRVAVASDGASVAVWREFDGTAYRIEAASRPAGGTWTAGVALSGPGADAYAPDVALTDDGRAVVLWHRQVGGDLSVQAATRGAGGSWSTPDTLTSGATSTLPDVGVAADGEALAVWQSAGSPDRVLSSRLPVGGTWTAPVALSSGPDPADSARLAVDRQGNAVVTWLRRGNLTRVLVASRSAGGAWTSQRVLSPSRADADTPLVALDGKGRAVATWTLQRAYSLVQVADRSASGSWSAPQSVTAPRTDGYAPALDLTDSGDATLAWVSGSRRTVVVRRPAGGSWSNPRVLSAANHTASDPDVTVARTTGRAVVVWPDRTGTTETVTASVRPRRGRWSPARPATTTDDSTRFPDVGLEARGPGVLTWTSDEVAGPNGGNPPPDVRAVLLR